MRHSKKQEKTSSFLEEVKLLWINQLMKSDAAIG